LDTHLEFFLTATGDIENMTFSFRTNPYILLLPESEIILHLNPKIKITSGMPTIGGCGHTRWSFNFDLSANTMHLTLAKGYALEPGKKCELLIREAPFQLETPIKNNHPSFQYQLSTIK
jgi:hypothetical protein